MKNRIIRISFAILIALGMLCSACVSVTAPSSGAPAERIGIISAMDNEIRYILSEAQIERVDTVGGVEFHVGMLRGHPVVITKSGVGKIRAASGITAMLNRYPVSGVIFTGIAGGVGDKTRVLDEVVATRLVQHDYGQITNSGFEWTGRYGGEDGYFSCDPGLSALAYGAAVRVLGEEHVFLGTIATGDQFVASEAYVRKLQEDFDAIACEKEGAAVAAVCSQYDTPFVVIRAMSDKADGKAHETYENLGDHAADQSGKILIAMLEAME